MNRASTMTPWTEKPTVTIVHSIAGRIRVQLSLPIKNRDRLLESIQGHEGILQVRHTPITRSVLVHFEPDVVSREEIVIRTGLALSLDYGTVPVRVLAQPEDSHLSDAAFYSGLLVATAAGVQMFLPMDKGGLSLLRWSAGLGTAWAALDHGWQEVQHRGHFDPEVFSLVYLLTSMVRGNFLPATVFTWVSTFGRHLVRPPVWGVELRPIQVGESASGESEYEVDVATDPGSMDKMAVFSVLPAMLWYAFTGRVEAGRGNLMEEMRKVSKVHGEVLEGLGQWKGGIPLKFQSG